MRLGLRERLAQGGTVFQVSMRNCDHYLLGSAPIPAVPVNENDLRDAFNEAGFPLAIQESS